VARCSTKCQISSVQVLGVETVMPGGGLSIAIRHSSCLIITPACDSLSPPAKFHPQTRVPKLPAAASTSSWKAPTAIYILQDHQSTSPITDNFQTANMPREVTDIKQFLEIARRKDATCKSQPQPPTQPAQPQPYPARARPRRKHNLSLPCPNTRVLRPRHIAHHNDSLP